MRLGASLALAVALGSCGDPLHDSRVDALGGEAPGVSPGPLHRPGQPCLTCHGGQGPASAAFAVAGTVYQTPDPTSPGQPNVTVMVYDAPLDREAGPPTVAATTNAAGNFFVASSDYAPTFPLRIDLGFPGLAAPTRMRTHVGRDGSCAGCHVDPPSRGSPGHVYLVADPADLPGGAR